MTSKKNLISRQWYDKILAEINDLRDVQLPETLDVLKEARAHGDLSENSDYHAAKEKISLLQKRIVDLETMIESVDIMDDDVVWDSHIVKYWSVVSVDIEDDKIYTFEIVWSWEVVAFDDLKLSLDSPLGLVIDGKIQWDSGYLKLPNGNKKKVTILSVE